MNTARYHVQQLIWARLNASRLSFWCPTWSWTPLYIKIKAAIGKKGMFCLVIKKIFGDWNITIDKNLKEKPSSKR